MENKERVCLKFTGYIFLPKDVAPDLSNMKRWTKYPRMGRVEIFDEFNNKTGNKMKAFDRVTQLAEFLEMEFLKRCKKKLKNWKKVE